MAQRAAASCAADAAQWFLDGKVLLINFFFPSFSLFAESQQEEWEEAWEVVELEVVVIPEEEEEEEVA